MKVGDHIIFSRSQHEGLIVKDSSFYRILDLKTYMLHGTMYVTLEELEEVIKRL